MKEFGLEFINEMAKDREVAQQEIGVVISGTKSSFIAQGTQHFTYQDLDALVKIIRTETSHIVDSELTKLTIKSLGRIREFLQGETMILQNVVSPELEAKLKEALNELEEFKNQIHTKNTQISQLEDERNNLQKINAEFQDDLNKQKMEVKRVIIENQSLKEQGELNHKRLDEITSELRAKTSIIENLKEQEKIQQKDIEEAMASFAETYQSHEDYYQKKMEEGIQQRLKTIRKEYDLELEEMREQLKNEVKRHEEAVKQHKTTVSRLEEELAMAGSAQIKLQEKLAKVYDERTERNILIDYTQRLLSTHPLFASILILLNLGGTLDLPTMAMSVGAHPLKLRQMLEDLVTKGLISVSSEDPPIVTAVMGA